MSSVFRLSLVIALSVLSVACSKHGSDDVPTDSLTPFFHSRLDGSSAAYDVDSLITLSDIESCRNDVWQSWRLALRSYDETALGELSPLEERRVGSWTLPASLEPSAVMRYVYGSKGSKPAHGYPLFVYCHGSGAPDMEWNTGQVLAGQFNDTPSAYFIPRIPNTGAYYRWWQQSKQYAWEKLLRLALASGDVDPDKIYFFGISEGGYGTQRLASFYADYLAGAGPMAGGEPLKNAPVENCRNIAFSLRTGALDDGFYRNVLTQYTKERFDELEGLNPGAFVHNIELVTGMGHGIDYDKTTPWLRQYVRNPHPKRVSWENFEMDGRKREGFYNICIVKHPDGGRSRAYYDMSVADNVIDLAVSLVTYTTTEVRDGIEMAFARTYAPATDGKLLIYLCPELVDLGREVTLKVNGRQVFKGMVTPNAKHIVNSCATFFDPQRLYPAAIEVDLSK